MSECLACGQEYEPKEYAEFKPTIQKARKDYKCFVCNLTIKKGETYIRQSGFDYLSEKHFTVQEHQNCPDVKEILIEALEKLIDESHDEEIEGLCWTTYGDALKNAESVLAEVKK